MCDTCGCEGPDAGYTISKPGKKHHDHDHPHNHGHHEHDHPHSHGHHDHDHPHSHGHHEHEHPHSHGHHDHEHPASRTIDIAQNVLQKNDLQAAQNRGYMEGKNIHSLNLVSSPGSGKTTLLEKSIKALEGKKIYVIEGDQQTTNDADRIDATGAPVVQVNTGSGCHLDAEMVYKALKALEPENDALLMIENVGNLVCPALFDLGESKRVLIISVTEGEDKPAKYPYMFESADLCIINKIDLLPHVDFDVEKCKAYARQLNPDLEFIELSARTGEGMENWLAWVSA